MKSPSKIALAALIVTALIVGCTKNNSVTPKTTTSTILNKAGSSTLLKRDTITPNPKINATPNVSKRDTITPNPKG